MSSIFFLFLFVLFPTICHFYSHKFLGSPKGVGLGITLSPYHLIGYHLITLNPEALNPETLSPITNNYTRLTTFRFTPFPPHPFYPSL